MSKSRFIARTLFAACAVTSAALATLAGTAAQTLPTPQQLNPLGQSNPPPAAQNRTDLLAPPVAGVCPEKFAKAPFHFVLRNVEFTHADDLAAGELAGAYRDFLGKDISLAALCVIRDRAATILFRKGILARVEIPNQRIATKPGPRLGVVQLDVIEAYIASVHVGGDAGAVQDKVDDYIEMLRGMKPFDLNKAQRYLFLASDIPGVHISATLKPAPDGPGAIALDISVSRNPVDAVVNVQNFGSKAEGRFGALARVDFNSFTSLGERTTLVAYSTLDGIEQRVFQGVEEVRLGDDGAMGRLSLAYGDTHPGDTLKPLQIKGRSYVASLSGTYPLVRARNVNFNIWAGLDVVNQDVDTASFALTRDKLRVVFLRLEADRSWRNVMPVTLKGDIELRQGLPFLGASRTGAPLASRVDGDPAAFLVRADGQASIAPLPHLAFVAAVSGQYSLKPLLAYEEMPVGNLTIGRGYDPSTVSGDRGIAAAFDARVGPFQVLREFGVSAFAFYDIAYIDNLDVGGESRTLRSLGGGFTFQLTSHAHVDVTYAHPLDTVSSFVPKPPSDRVLLNLTLGW